MARPPTMPPVTTPLGPCPATVSGMSASAATPKPISRRISVPRSLLAQVVFELQPLDAVQLDIGRALVVVAVRRERDRDARGVLPAPRLIPRLSHRFAGARLAKFPARLKRVADQ